MLSCVSWSYMLGHWGYLPTDMSVPCLIWSVGGKIHGLGTNNTQVYPQQSLPLSQLSELNVIHFMGSRYLRYMLLGVFLSTSKLFWVNIWRVVPVPFNKDFGELVCWPTAELQIKIPTSVACQQLQIWATWLSQCASVLCSFHQDTMFDQNIET